MNSAMNEVIKKALEATAKAAGFPEPRNIFEIIGALINSFLSLVGVIFLCLIIYGGYLWMLSGGNEIKVLKAKRTLTQAVIGLLIIMSAYSLTYFVMHAAVGATS